MKKQGVFMGAINAESVEVGIDVIGEIGWNVVYSEMSKMFSAIPEAVKRVVFNIYSPGGDVWDGNGIIQAIGELGKTKTTVARIQVAASMATLIAVACKERSIASNGRFLIHNAWTSASGDAAEFEKRAKELRDCEIEAANFYAERTGKTPAEMLALMAEERWLTPQEALDFGFVQSIDNPFDEAGLVDVKAQLKSAGKWPKALSALDETNTEPLKKEEGKDENGTTERGEEQSETKPDGSDVASDAASVEAVAEFTAKLQAEYNRGLDCGKKTALLDGVSAANADFHTKAMAYESKIKSLEKLVKDFQSKSDSLTAQLSVLKKTSEDSDKELSAKLKDAESRLSKFLSGALSFSSAPETWEEALKSCSGDYVQAAKKYPELKKAFNERKNK